MSSGVRVSLLVGVIVALERGKRVGEGEGDRVEWGREGRGWECRGVRKGEDVRCRVR